MYYDQAVTIDYQSREVRMHMTDDTGSLLADVSGIPFPTDHTGKGSRAGHMIAVYLPAGERFDLYDVDTPHRKHMDAAIRCFVVVRRSYSHPDGKAAYICRWMFDCPTEIPAQTPPDAPGTTEG